MIQIFTWFHSRQDGCLIKLICLLLCIAPARGASQGLVISEVVSDNKIHSDAYGNTPDWVELRNAGFAQLCLSAYSIADENDPSKSWQLPDTCLAPNAYLLIFLSGESEDRFHASFSLKQYKESIYLFHQGVAVDSGITCIPSTYSLGRNIQGAGWHHFKNPTPGYENDVSSQVQLNPQTDSLILYTKSGFYTGAVSPILKTLNGSSVFYTLDGSFPDVTSYHYDPSLTFSNDALPEASISQIITSEEWKKPKGTIRQGFTMRAVAFDDGCPVSNEVVASYFIKENEHDTYPVNVIAITADPDDLFSRKDGIYVKGKNAEPNFLMRGKKWERDVHVAILNEYEQLHQFNAEVSIHGRYTRYKPQKSLKLEMDNEERITYPLFESQGDWFTSVTIQTVDKHPSSTFFKDEMISEIAEDLNIGAMRSAPVIVFINGEYWGVHNLRERQDEDFIELHYGIPATTITLEEEPMLNDGSEFGNFVSQTLSINVADDANYERISEQLDIQNFINYTITSMYFSNYDWPHNNIRAWKSWDDKRWRFAFYDCDVCMDDPEQDFFGKILTSFYSDEPYPALFEKLMENQQFRKAFTSQFMHHVFNTLDPSRILPMIDRYAKVYEPLVFEHINRWSFPSSYEAWQANVNSMKNFAVKRQQYILDQLIQYLGNLLHVYPNPTSGDVHISLMDGVSYTVTVRDIQGRNVYTSMHANGYFMDLSALGPGMYFIEVTYEHIRFIRKLIIR